MQVQAAHCPAIRHDPHSRFAGGQAGTQSPPSICRALGHRALWPRLGSKWGPNRGSGLARKEPRQRTGQESSNGRNHRRPRRLPRRRTAPPLSACEYVTAPACTRGVERRKEGCPRLQVPQAMMAIPEHTRAPPQSLRVTPARAAHVPQPAIRAVAIARVVRWPRAAASCLWPFATVGALAARSGPVVGRS